MSGEYVAGEGPVWMGVYSTVRTPRTPVPSPFPSAAEGGNAATGPRPLSSTAPVSKANGSNVLLFPRKDLKRGQASDCRGYDRVFPFTVSHPPLDCEG